MMQEHDILLGRDLDGGYIKLGGGEPVALHARTGAGKSSDFAIPNCFTWKGSLVVLDIKGDAFRTTAGHRAAMGQEVYLFDPASMVGRSHRWNPFDTVDRTALARFRQIIRQANLLFPEIETASGGGGNNNKFWDDAGRQAFTAIATILAETPYERLDIGRLHQLFMRMDGHEWLVDQIGRRRGSNDPYSSISVDGVSDYIGDDPKLRGDIRKTVSTKLQIWSDPQIVAATTASDFDLRDLRRKPMTIYVVVQPGNIPWLRPLLRLFFDQAINANTDLTPQQDPGLKYQCLFMLDEFVRLMRIDSLAHAAQYTRGYGLRMAYIVQNKAQVRAIYGHDGAQDIFGNVGAEVVFGTDDAELTKELEERLGDDTVMFTTRNRPRFLSWLNPAKQGESDHPHRRPLILDHEVAQMSPNEQIIVRPGMRPMKTLRSRWFTDPEFLTRLRPPPEIPKLDISIAYDDGTTRVTPNPRRLALNRLP